MGRVRFAPRREITMRPGQQWQAAKQAYALGKLDDTGYLLAAIEFRTSCQLAGRAGRVVPTLQRLTQQEMALGSGHALTHADDPDALKDALA